MKASSKIQEQGLWESLSKGWVLSGQSQKAYCEQKGISYRSFVYHHSRLQRQSKKASLNFIELKPEPVVISNQGEGLQLILPNGIRIAIGASVNSVVLKTILSIAGAVQCLS